MAGRNYNPVVEELQEARHSVIELLNALHSLNTRGIELDISKAEELKAEIEEKLKEVK